MTMTEERIPSDTLGDERTLIAVYGTLRSGYGNAWLWEGFAETLGLASCAGFILATPGGFPYALPVTEQHYRIVVELIAPLPSLVDFVLQRLDALEGYPTHYDRWPVTVEHEARPHIAQMYVPAPRTLDRLTERLGVDVHIIPTGDWADRHQISFQ